MSIAIQFLLFFLPWRVRRWVLCTLFNFKLKKSSRIGFSIITANIVELSNSASIGHFNLIRNLDLLYMDEFATLGSLNWITGARDIKNSFANETNRTSRLVIGKHAAVTHQHLIDCTSTIKIGPFSTIAGYRSQLITHGINVLSNKQESQSIAIGSHCLIGTNSTILKGAKIPNNSIVAAGSVVVKAYSQEGVLIAGIPGVPIKTIAGAYFSRTIGRVD
jgi:acetyltransferase-like isoleucine patch superfamily enzyme